MEHQRDQRLVQFLSLLPPIAGWTRNSYVKLGELFTKKVLRSRSILYRQGDKADGVFFAQTGEFEFSSKAHQQSHASPRSHTREVRSEAEFAVILSQIYCTIAPDILGVSDLVCKRLRQFTCRVLSNSAEVYWLSEAEFKAKILSTQSLKLFQDREDIESKWLQSHVSKVSSMRDIIYSKCPVKVPSVEVPRSPRQHTRRLSCSSDFASTHSVTVDDSFRHPVLTPKHKLLTMSKFWMKKLEDSLRPSPSPIMLDITRGHRPTSHPKSFPRKRLSIGLPCNFHATPGAALSDKYSRFKFMNIPELCGEGKAEFDEKIRSRTHERRVLLMTTDAS
jgi:CRP-like cAMP-binding protein